MATLLDTDVAIHLRDGDPWVEEQIKQLDPPLLISAITRVELENGVWRDPEWSEVRRARLNQLLKALRMLDFDAAAVDAYRRIVSSTGYSRRKTADRMTAATALAHDLPLVTFNAQDFREVSGLRLLAWSRER